MHSTRSRWMLFAAPLALAAFWMACPPPPPPPPPGDTTEVKKLGRGEEGMGELQADGGVGGPIILPDGGVVTPDAVTWCNYAITGPAGGAACFAKPSHICVMCPPKECPNMALAYVPNMPQNGNASKLGCDMRVGGSTTAGHCGPCQSEDDDGPGGFGPFGGYFRF